MCCCGLHVQGSEADEIRLDRLSNPALINPLVSISACPVYSNSLSYRGTICSSRRLFRLSISIVCSSEGCADRRLASPCPGGNLSDWTRVKALLRPKIDASLKLPNLVYSLWNSCFRVDLPRRRRVHVLDQTIQSFLPRFVGHWLAASLYTRATLFLKAPSLPIAALTLGPIGILPTYKI